MGRSLLVEATGVPVDDVLQADKVNVKTASIANKIFFMVSPLYLSLRHFQFQAAKLAPSLLEHDHQDGDAGNLEQCAKDAGEASGQGAAVMVISSGAGGDCRWLRKIIRASSGGIVVHCQGKCSRNYSSDEQDQDDSQNGFH
jgi:hypothetical protein